MELPDNSERILNVGRTGTGKTVAALDLLSSRNFDEIPWVIVNFKRDKHIARIPELELIELDEIPEEPGLYEVQPKPDEGDAVSDMLMNVWEHENIGLFIDEAFMLGNHNTGFHACLTQGRSKGIPMIVNSQRPVWVSRFVKSEADYFRIFHLNDSEDRKVMQRFLPGSIEPRLPEFWSYYYQVSTNQMIRLKPSPNIDEVVQVFIDRSPEYPEDFVANGKQSRLIRV